MLTQMAKYLDTVYVSGWQSSSTASSTDEPSPDLADYPMVRMPELEKFQLFLTRVPEHRPKQGPALVHGPAFPRP
jgi:isocitrate lyase